MTLPLELWEQVLLCCTPKSLLNMSFVCVVFRQTVRRRSIWFHIVQLHYPGISIHSLIERPDRLCLFALVSAGRSVNELHEGVCPLSLAVRRRDLVTVELLLSFGAFDQMNHDGTMAFMDLVKLKHPVCKEWLSLGISNPNQVYPLGMSSFSIACHNQDLELCILMIDCGLFASFVSVAGRGHLHEASKAGMVDVMRRLLEMGAPVDLQDLNGATCLHEAVKSHSVEAVRLLLSFGAEPNVWDKCRWSPLHVAVRHSQTEMVQILIDAGALVNDIPADGNTALHEAVFRGNQPMTQVLLDRGADINALNHLKRTPLHYAIALGHPDIVRTMMHLHPQTDIEDCFGETVLMACVVYDCRVLKDIGPAFDPSWQRDTLMYMAHHHMNDRARLYWSHFLTDPSRKLP